MKGRGFISGLALTLPPPPLLAMRGASDPCWSPPSDKVPLDAWLELEPLEPAVPTEPPPLSRFISELDPRERGRLSRTAEWAESLSEPREKLADRP